jgi:hypothetical protein
MTSTTNHHSPSDLPRRKPAAKGHPSDVIFYAAMLVPVSFFGTFALILHLVTR